MRPQILAMTAPTAAAAASERERRRDSLGAREASGPPGAGLSTDYLNRYSEVLMLIEMAADDPDLAWELRRWQAIDYRSYFAASPLRLAKVALCAYDALPEERRLAFEKLVGAMDELAAMAVLALDLRDDPDTAAFVPLVTAPIMRRLIARATSFLNSGGADTEGGGAEEAQAAIDRLMESVSAA
jgi:hypothetical protein